MKKMISPFKTIGNAGLALIAICLTPKFGFSQIVKDTSFLKEVVVTSSKSPQSLGNVTQKIEVLSSTEIESTISANRNICDVMQNQPGVSVSALSRNDANWGTYGGIGPKYSTFMLQGLPIDAFIDPMTLDLSAISRIEVQRGPASVLYSNYLSQDFAGNQSPLAGTVNMILKDKFDKPLTRFITSFGSYNTLNGQFYHQDIAKSIHYYTGINYEMSDYTDYGTKDSWLNMQKNPEYRKTKIFGGATWFSDDEKQKFTLFANKTLHVGDAGRIYRGFDNNYGIINAGYTLNLNKNICLEAHTGYRSYDRTWQESHFNVIDSLSSDNGVVQHIIPVDVLLTLKHGKANVLTTGVDYQGADYYTYSDPLVGYDTYGNKSTAMQTGVYTQEELHFGKLIARGGVRINYTKNNIELINGGAPGQKSKDWNKVLYSGGLRYNATKNISIFANIGSSFVTPGLKSVGGTIQLDDTLHSGQLPSPNLKPEAGLGIDGGIDLALPYNLQLSLRGFNTTVTDAIIDNVVRQTPSQSQSVNAGKTTSAGGEAELKQKIYESLSWFANFTYMKTKISNEYDADQDGGTVPFSPEMVANAGISYTTPFGLKITPSLNYNDGFYDSSSKTGRKKFIPGMLLNAYVSQTIVKNNKSKVICFGQFYNITDNRYEMPWQFINTGFSVMGGLKVEF
ncbi:MAG: TonB-dependent receptor [Bacteroidetes bacterium]|nr:TonB-dependent receptor [Bacteroidota bacterium]